jgi:rhodanese-related sulfurtransferase
MKLGNFLLIFAVSAAVSGYTAWALPGKGPAPTVGDLAEPATPLPLIRLAEARRLWQEPQTLFVDVRPSSDYAFGHIRGAVSMPEEEFEQRFPDLKPRLERAEVIVVYCKSTDCGKSLWAAIRLRNEGLTQTRIYPGGWNEWSVNGLPAAHTEP